ncbi:MAG: 50S ribosomal protein L6 [Nitrososphaerales archaeon]
MSTSNTVEPIVSKKNQVLDMSVELAAGVTAKFQKDKLLIQGPLGKVEQDFSKIPVEIKIEGKTIKILSRGARRKDRSIFNTARSLVLNAVQGVTNGYQYKLKVIFAHFPVSIKIQGQNILVENFYGERSPRVAEIVGDTKAEVQGEDIILNGVSIQDVGQTAANLEQATTVKRKDQRVFLDGVYVYERTRK